MGDSLSLSLSLYIYIYIYILLDFYHQSIPTIQQKFEAGSSFSSFDFEVNF